MEGRLRKSNLLYLSVASAVLLLFISIAYALKPDWAAALTIFPVWTWLPLGLLPLLYARRIGKAALILVLSGWLIATLSFSEEWRGFLPRRSAAASDFITIVSLNCAGGSIEAAEEVAPFNPDIVLLQESPGRQELEQLAKKMYGASGSVLAGPDGSILSRWRLMPYQKPQVDHTAAVVEVPGLGEVNVVSLRLMPPAFRPDLVSPSAWTEVARNRKLRREQLRELLQRVSAMRGTEWIMGGDYNAQSGDDVYQSMPPHLKDSFYSSILGWGHTATNDYPLARIDQIWLSTGLVPLEQRVHPTQFSDHRMVVLRAKKHHVRPSEPNQQ